MITNNYFVRKFARYINFEPVAADVASGLNYYYTYEQGSPADTAKMVNDFVPSNGS